MDIIQAIHSERIFKVLFPDLTSWESWIVCLKSIFGLSMDRREHRIYKKHTDRTDRPEKQFQECFLIVGRRGGKSFISALTAVFLATFKQWDLGIERGHIICVASDRRQAGVTFGYIKQILQLPIFRSMVVTERAEEVELSNQMTISVHTCSYRSLRGYAICAAVLDELAFWRVEGSNPAKEILTALRPSLGNIPGSLLLAISTGYSRTGPLWESYRDKFGKNDPQCLVWKAGTQDMNPTYSQAVIKRALKDDYQAGRSEYFSEFRTDLESFLPIEVIDSAVVPNRYELPPLSDTTYYAFCDPSGGRGDSMTLSIVHKEDSGQIIQDFLAVKCPPFDPSVAVQEFAGVLNRYGISMVEGDRYGGSWVSSSYERESVYYESAQLSKSDIYLEALALFMQGRIELLDNQQQTNELKQLERRTGKQKDSVDHARGLHDDAANALCGSLVMASRTEALRTPAPSLGVTERVGDESMESHMIDLLLNQPRRKMRPGEISDKEIIEELAQIDKEIEQERQKSEGVIKRWK